MKKLFILVLMVLVGVSLVFVNLRAEEARTIPYKTGFANRAQTVIVAHGVTLYKVMGRATSANAWFSIHDASSKANMAGSLAITTVKAEGGEATQYDSFEPLNFGDEGLDFVNGIVVYTTTAHVILLYR